MRPRIILALSNFFAVTHFYLIVYILTPYLATMISAETAALSVALGAIVTLSVFPYMPRLVLRHGPQKLAIFFAGLEGIILALLAAHPSALAATLLVALSCAVPPLVVYQLDLLLEACIEDRGTTGRIRTAFNTAGNLSSILSPLALIYLLGDSNRYDLVFIAAALSVLPFILLMFARHLPRVRPPTLRTIRTAGMNLLGDRDRRAVAFSNLILQFFFRIIPLYIPLYLHTVLGLSWTELGLLFALSLVPIVLLEYPAGWLADIKLGDGVPLAAGYIIGGLAFACLTFVNAQTSFWVILCIMLFVRIGNALIEAMTEAHFFRRVCADDAEAVSIFRMMRPLGALTSPIIGSILLSSAGYPGLFILSGLGILATGVACAYAMRATPLPARKPSDRELLWPRSGRC